METPLTVNFYNAKPGQTINTKPLNEMTEEELVAELKNQPDFDKFVFPSSWYQKYELPKKECMDFKQFLKEAPWLTSKSRYIYEGKVVEVEAKPGGNRPILDVEPVKAEVVQKSLFSDSIDQTADANPLETPETKVCSITTIDSKTPQ